MSAGNQVKGLRQVAQRVVDLDRAVGFYEQVLGLRLIDRFDPPDLAFFDLGGVRLLLEANAPAAMIYLEVDDVRAEYDRLAALGVEMIHEPAAIFEDAEGRFGPAGEKEVMAFFTDTEGNQLALAGRE
ncbi:MAG: VOC family protein [Actinomycetota bacterium]|nr:VOC family protein [Actinomycetota bacterium]